MVCLETLSYIENWRGLLQTFAKIAKYTLIPLFVPENPIGFVKSFSELREAFLRHYDIWEEIRLVNRNKIVLFGESKVYSE